MKTKLPFYSILLFILFLEIINASPVNAVIRIMPLGDSITVGNDSGADPDPYNSNPAYWVAYRKSLYNLLVADGYNVDFVGSQNNGSAAELDDPDHEGHPGWEADEIVNGADWEDPGKGKLQDWLDSEQPDIILLHIGTNDIIDWPYQSTELIVTEVSEILDEIDQYESDHSVNITVILALIINEMYYDCENYDPGDRTSDFNNKLYDMAWDRINNPLNPAYPDKIEIVDMECGAGINYLPEAEGGDMYIYVHPNATGYSKMADVWYSGLIAILPVLYYVSPEGFDSNSCLFPETPCKTIQHVIDVASEIAIIKIADGTYVEDVVMDLSKEITLQGGWDATFTTRQDDSTIHGKVTLSNQKLIFDKVRIK